MLRHTRSWERHGDHAAWLLAQDRSLCESTVGYAAAFPRAKLGMVNQKPRNIVTMLDFTLMIKVHHIKMHVIKY